MRGGAWGLVLFVLLAACGASEDPLSGVVVPRQPPGEAPPPEPSPYTPEDAACDAYYVAKRELLRRCGGGSILRFSRSQDDALRARSRTVCRARLAAPGTNIDAAFVSDCALRLWTAGCNELEADVCLAPPGDLDDGAPCGDDSQCKSTYCAAEGDQASPQFAPWPCGVCVPSIPVGGRCVVDSATTPRCVRGARCLQSAADKVLGDGSQGTCVAPDHEGPGAEGEECWNGRMCEAGLYCNMEQPPPICTRTQAGGPCVESSNCPLDQRCIDSVCRAPLRETERSCRSSSDCALGLYCDSDFTPSTCVRIDFVRIGASCTRPSARCERGFCSQATLTCQSPIPDGAPCGEGTEGRCDAFSYCYRGTCALEKSVCYP